MHIELSSGDINDFLICTRFRNRLKLHDKKDFAEILKNFIRIWKTNLLGSK